MRTHQTKKKHMGEELPEVGNTAPKDISQAIGIPSYDKKTAIPLLQSEMLFLPGHAEKLYAAGLIDDAYVYDIQGERYGAVNFHSILSSQLRPDQVDVLMDYIEQELRQTKVGMSNLFLLCWQNKE